MRHRVLSFLVLVAVTACSPADPAPVSTAPPSSTTVPAVSAPPDTRAAAEEAELARWQQCLTDRIDRLYEETVDQVDDLDSQIEDLGATYESASERMDELEAAADGVTDPIELGSINSESQMMMVIALEAGQDASELVDEREALVDEFEETRAGLEAVRDGVRAGNVDWSLCTG